MCQTAHRCLQCPWTVTSGNTLRVLTIFCHPDRESFTGALLDAFLAGLEDASHAWELADLHGEGFDPRFRPDDFAQFTKGPAAMPPDVLGEQERVMRAEAIAFVFPVWWWSFPAMLKGWIDRVWCQGWAYDFTIRQSRGLLALERAVLLCSAGSSAATYRRYGYQEAMRRSIDVGVLGYCGIDDVAMHVFPGVDDDSDARPAWIAMARQIGRDMTAEPPVAAMSYRSLPGP